MSTRVPNDAAGLERHVNRLASERGTLFAKAATPAGLSQSEHTRLSAIERELDDCFALRRKQRAARDARRFSNSTFPEPPVSRPKA
jgi:hypothetical protein